jgi:hypothetical protein
MPHDLRLPEIQLFQPSSYNYDPKITAPLFRNYITWQQPTAGPPGCPMLSNAVPELVRPVADRLRTAPNPFRERTHFSFSLRSPKYLRVEVLDLSGRTVWSSPSRFFVTGTHTLEWDGRTTSGAVPPPGVYFVRVSGSSFEATGRVARIQ